MGCSRTVPARQSSGSAGCYSNSSQVPHRLCRRTPRRLQRRTHQGRCVRRASAGGCRGWPPSASSLYSLPGGCSHWAGIPPTRTSPWRDHLPLARGVHAGGLLYAGRRTPTTHLGVASTLLPGPAWPHWSVKGTCPLPGSVLLDACRVFPPPHHIAGAGSNLHSSKLRSTHAIGSAQGQALAPRGALSPEHCR
jgi:hypothetical protein